METEGNRHWKFFTLVIVLTMQRWQLFFNAANFLQCFFSVLTFFKGCKIFDLITICNTVTILQDLQQCLARCCCNLARFAGVLYGAKTILCYICLYRGVQEGVSVGVWEGVREGVWEGVAGAGMGAKKICADGDWFVCLRRKKPRIFFLV